MIPIELKKRYPHSRVEDITDAFMRGYQACAVQGGDAEMDNCQVQAPQNYMQQSRHDDGKDLISRADAIEAVCEECSERWKHYKECDLYKDGQCFEITALMALPSADAVQGWIPCSERLPKRDELVLVTYKTTDRIHLCKYLDDGSENPWWSYIDDCCAWNNVVLAWMPLPKPYREDGEA